MKWALPASIGAGVLLLVLLASASANSDLFARHYPWLLGANAVAVVALVGLVVWQLRQLWREVRKRHFGVRLKRKLVLLFACIALLPGALIYTVSLLFLRDSIESWFDVRVDSALEAGMTLGRSAVDLQLSELRELASSAALDLEALNSPVGAAELSRVLERTGAASALLVGGDGRVLASATAELGPLLPSLPSSSDLQQVRNGVDSVRLEGEAVPGGGLRARVLMPIDAAVGGEARVLQLIRPVPESLVRTASAVVSGYGDYQELSIARLGLKRIFGLTLTLSLLVALFAAMAMAFEFARRLVAPLALLAEGTRAVARGDFTPRGVIASRDELGVLTRRFGQMTRQLDEARHAAEKSRAEVERARAYLESVLGNLSAGVLAFDGDMQLLTMNNGALALLGEPEAGALIGHSPAAWSHWRVLGDALHEGFTQNGEADWERQIDVEGGDGNQRVIRLRGTAMPAGTGFVAVFDDITQLISAQRTQAWGEVARRLAHEIKNPLTPIQLSAERLEHKLSGRVGADEEAILTKATRTIVNQVTAMRDMVNEFRDYARQPPPNLAPVDLNALVAEVTALYEGSTAQVRAVFDPSLPLVRGDAAHLRQVIHNLIQNGEDAVRDGEAPEVLLTTRFERGQGVLVVEDNGPGFAPVVLARAFEPYVTTKARGTGLGLAIVNKIIGEHEGQIVLANRESGGARVCVRLAAVDQGV